MEVQIIKDRRLGFSNQQWTQAARKATKEGHRAGSHAWMDSIRDTLGIPRDCCK